MELLDCTITNRQLLTDSVVTIGNFDGIHRGHSGLFRQLRDRGARCDLPTLVATFEPHPLAVLAPKAKPALITSFSQKVKLIAQAGIDYLAVIKFTPEFSRLSAESFVRTHLCHTFGARHIIIGHDYAFGRNRGGNYSTLAALGVEHGFSVENIKPIGEDNKIYSSTLVRRLIASGDMLGAASVLGRKHVISGRVAHQGSGICSRSGFPTVRIATENELIPLDGVYSVHVMVEGQLLKGVCEFGKNRNIELILQDYFPRRSDSKISISIGSRLNTMKKQLIPEFYPKPLPQPLCSTVL